MKYDVFISYRREGGYDTAKHLNDLLVRDGYRVSFDIDTLRNGDFDIQLLSRIEECKDFILIVDAHCFDRTLDKTFDPKKDWVRCELAHALKYKKNIIPVFLSNVSTFPEGLPDDIVGVVKKNGPEYNKYYFNDFYQTLCSRFLTSQSSKKRIVGGLLFLVLVVGVVSLLISSNDQNEVVYTDPMIPHTTDELEMRNYAQMRLDVIADSLGLTDQIATMEYLANKRDSESELNMGLCYLLGYGCIRDYKKAVKNISNAASNGIAVAQYLIGVCYDNGIGIQQDLERARYWYKEAAEQGVIEAQCDYAIACISINNMQEAFKWLSQSAEKGYAKAQYTLAWNYGSGNNVTDAIYWMEKSAEQDFVLAQIALCNLYTQGPPAIQDFDTAVEILEDLSKRNNAMAQYALALCYAQNKGVDVDFEKAMEYLSLSADQGFAPALTEIGGVYCSGLPQLNISQDFNKAMEFYRKAADQGFPMAQFLIGKMYENGWGVEKNNKKSKDWYLKAEKQGFNVQMIQQQLQYQQQQQLQQY